MELIRKNIHMNGWKAKASMQVTLDEDVNVSDSNEDIGRIVEEQAYFHIDQVKGEENQAVIKGEVLLSLLYIDADGEGTMQSMNIRIPVEESVHMDGVTVTDNMNASGDLEDISVSLINTRKVNVKGIIALQVVVDALQDEEVIVEIKDEKKAVQTRSSTVKIVQLRVHKKDNCRFKDEIVLSSAKPNVYKLLWSQIQPMNVEMERADHKLMIHGEWKVFVMYLSEEDQHPVQIVEEVIPFHGTVECEGCSSDLIPQIQWEMNRFHVEVKPDYDGEERVLSLEGIMELDIQLFEEEEIEMLADAYSTAEELTPVTATTDCRVLLVKNRSRSRISGKVSIGKNQPRILQIYQACGAVKPDEVQETEEGILVEGVINVQLLYVTADDEMPYASIKGQIPFKQMVEVPHMEKNTDYMIQADLQQFQAVMSDSEEVEFKGVINLDMLVLGHRDIPVVKDVEVKPLDYNRLNKIPAMTGYIVAKDDTLWKIAKEYCTTVDILRESNEMKAQEVTRGDKLLILKAVAE